MSMYVRADLAGHLWSPQVLSRSTRLVPDGEFLSDGVRGFGDVVPPSTSTMSYGTGVVAGVLLGAFATWTLLRR